MGAVFLASLKVAIYEGFILRWGQNFQRNGGGGGRREEEGGGGRRRGGLKYRRLGWGIRALFPLYSNMTHLFQPLDLTVECAARPELKHQFTK